MTTKTAVQNYIRETIPRLRELTGGCSEDFGLQDYLSVFDPLEVSVYLLVKKKNILVEKVVFGDSIQILFSLTDGQPATEEDWVRMAEVLNIKYQNMPDKERDESLHRLFEHNIKQIEIRLKANKITL